MNKVMRSRKECQRKFNSYQCFGDAAKEYTWYTLSGRFTRRQRRAHWLHKKRVLKVLPKFSERQKKLAGFRLRDFYLGLWYGVSLLREERPS